MFRRFSFLGILLSLACQSDEAFYPELEARPAEAVSIYGAELNARFIDVGVVRPVKYGFVIGKTAGQNLVSTDQRIDLGETESEIDFSIEVNTLEAQTLYYFKPFAANADYSRVSFGIENTFTTLSSGDYVTTSAATGIGSGSAMVNGTITSLNGWASASYGFVYGTGDSPVLPSSPSVIVGTATGPLGFQYTLTGLSPGTTYYFRAILYSPDGSRVVYGQTLFFTAS
jgi:hypothetical protein